MNSTPGHRLIRIVLYSFLVLLAVFYVTDRVRADNALLYLSPPTALITIGETFTVNIMLDTGGEPINAAEGSVTFDTSDLELVNISTGGSIFTSWITEPSFDAGSGVISFSGSTGQNGYTGNAGTIFTVTLRALRNTDSQVWFSQGAAVLAADGQASNVLSQLRSGTYTLTSREVVPALSSVAQAESSPQNVPAGGAEAVKNNIIKSVSHPDQEKWYAANTAQLEWKLSDEVTAVRTLHNTNPSSAPTKLYDEPIRRIVLEDLEEGTSYFHLQLKDASGWGDIYHYALNVDTGKPHSLAVEEGERQTKPLQTLHSP